VCVGGGRYTQQLNEIKNNTASEKKVIKCVSEKEKLEKERIILRVLTGALRR
jgi:hypothetical protein